MLSFSRREMLRLAGLGTGLALLPGRLAAEPAPLPPPLPPNSGLYRFRVGQFEATALVTGFMESEPQQPFYAPQRSARRSPKPR